MKQKRWTAIILLLTLVMSVFQLPAVAAEEEKSADTEMQIYFYEDFTTGYTDEETRVTSLDGSGLTRKQVNGEWVLGLSNPDGGYASINFSKTISVEGEQRPDLVLEYKVSGAFPGGSSLAGYNINGIPTVFIRSNAIKRERFDNPDTVASCDTSGGVVITIVYHHENPTQDLYIDNRYIGTYDMSEDAHGTDYSSKGSLPLVFWNSIGTGTTNYHYFKAYSAPKDYSPETFNPALYRNLGKNNILMSDGFRGGDASFDVVQGLGFYNVADVGEYQPDAAMNRIQFATILTEIMGITAVENPTGIYQDVARRHYMAGKLEALNQQGIMMGTEANVFEPNTAITGIQAATVMLRALGYRDLADYRGGYPLGYIRIAQEIGLSDGVKMTEDELLSKDAMRLIKNFLNTDVFSLKGISGDEKTMEAVEGDTVLKVYYGIEHIEGVVNAVEESALTDTDGAGEDSVVIGDTTLRNTDKEINRYLGYTVEAYYDPNNHTLLYWALGEDNKVTELEAEEVEGFSNGRLQYYRNQRLTSILIPVHADMIYNGHAAAFSSQYFDHLKMGHVTLIDNDGDGSIDVIHILSYYNRIIDGKSDLNNSLLFADGNGALPLETAVDSYEIYDATGAAISFDKLALGQVVSIMESADGRHITLYAGDNSVIGALETISKSDGKQILTIAGEKYIADAEFEDHYSFLTPGIIGEFLQDVYGRVVGYSEFVNTKEGIAYLYGLTTSGGVFAGSSNLRLFTENNQLAVYETTDKIMLDGNRVDGSSLAKYQYLHDMDGKLEKQLIRYTINDEGKVCAIDTRFYDQVHEDPEDNLIRILTGTYTWDNIDDCFGSEVYTNTGCKVFMVPSDPESARADDFTCGSIDLMLNTGYDMQAYKLSESSLGADAVLVVESATKTYNSYSHAYLVSDISAVWSPEDDDTIYRVEYWYEGRQRAVTVREKSIIEGISPGDVVVMIINSKNEATGIQLACDYDDPTAVTPGIRNSLHRAIRGYAYETGGQLFRFTPHDPAVTPIEALELELHRFPTYIYLYDTRTNTVTMGSQSDILDYKSAGSDATSIVFYETHSYDYDLVIYI